MNLILGFGSTEQAVVNAEEKAIRDYVEKRYSELEPSYISDELAADVKAWVKARGDELRAKDRAYKTATDYPSRYSYYSASVLHDASNIAVVMNWMHTNRRHPLSPDGWACLTERHVFAVATYDMNLLKHKVAGAAA